jgi:dephospho-CoA kinase
MKVIGLTGGIASGKSTASKFFLAQNIAVIDADSIVASIYETDAKAISKIAEVFSQAIIDGKINKHELSQIVLKDAKQIKVIENIIYPLVEEKIKELISFFKKRGDSLVLLDAPLLFESGFNKMCDAVICLHVSEAEQKRRAFSRVGMSKEKYETLKGRQLSNEERSSKSDFIVSTENEIAKTHAVLEAIIQGIKSKIEQKIGFCAGTFDPFTRGHWRLVCEALLNHDKIYIGVGSNPDKKNQELFSAKERLELIKIAIADFMASYEYREINGLDFSASEVSAYHRLKQNPNIVEIIDFDGLTVEAALKLKATSIIRGERIVGDHDAEMKLSLLNHKILEVMGKKLTILQIPVPDVSLHNISSTNAKIFCTNGKYIEAEEYVFPAVHAQMMQKYLQPIFVSLAKEFGVAENDAKAEFAELAKSYEKGRFYHTLTHVARCLQEVDIYDKFATKIKHINELRMAIFYHDIVNGLGRKDEENSSLAMQKFLGETKADVEFISKIIMATKHLAPKSNLSIEEKIMKDVDLAIFGGMPSVYGRYAQGILQEYERIMPKEEFAKIRVDKVLAPFYKEPHLYQTEFFEDRYLEFAKDNLRRETGILLAWQYYN